MAFPKEQNLTSHALEQRHQGPGHDLVRIVDRGMSVPAPLCQEPFLSVSSLASHWIVEIISHLAHNFWASAPPSLVKTNQSVTPI